MSKNKPVVLPLTPKEARLVLGCLYGPGVVNRDYYVIFARLKKTLAPIHRTLTERKHAAD